MRANADYSPYCINEVPVAGLCKQPSTDSRILLNNAAFLIQSLPSLFQESVPEGNMAFAIPVRPLPYVSEADLQKTPAVPHEETICLTNSCY